VVGATCVLALLYAGRDVLQPIALAGIASLIVSPLIRLLQRRGLGRWPSLLATLALAAACAASLGAILATQLASIGAELPRYQGAIRDKAEQVRALAERPFAHVQAGLNTFAPLAPDTASLPPAARGDEGAAPLPADIRPPHMSASAVLSHWLALAWGPLGEAGMVLVLLLFILLEQESLLDRLVRLAGQGETGRAIGALADATRGVSRFFFCQFLVNSAFGTAVTGALWMAGIPHALLWGVLSAMLRFIPYIGALGAGAAISVFAAAVDPGWGLSLYCAALFVVLELLVANLIEPTLYGHSTGLSPLAVVISALFWSSLWGPVGLLVSTPLSVCLVLAGRHVAVLEPLSILFGQAPSVSAAQRFFQRALSGETGAIIHDAAAFLRRASFARYCDHILLPGLALAVSELERGQIDAAQQQEMRSTVAELAEALAPSAARPGWLRRRSVSLLDANLGAHLRKLREARLGRWQGSLDVPSGSIVLCAGLATERDDLVSELLARALREAAIDARSLSLPLPYAEHDPAMAALVSTVFLPYPLQDKLAAWTDAVASLRILLPQALLATIRHPSDPIGAHHAAVRQCVDMELRSFEEGLAFVTSSAKMS
jgi:predicted PurR-regulated permease PerM